MQDFQNQMYLFGKIGSEDSPLDAIEAQVSAEKERKKQKKKEEKAKSEEQEN
jgi:hypothetical protein